MNNLLSDLQRRYHDLLNPITQGISQVGKAINSNPVSHSIVNSAANSISPIGGQVLNAFQNPTFRNIATQNLVHGVQAVGNAIPAAVRLSPPAQLLSNINNFQNHINPTINAKNQLKDVGAVAKGVGYTLFPEQTAMGGGFNGVMQVGSNLLQKKPLTTNLSQSIQQGNDFGAALGPIGKIAEATPGLSLVEKYVAKLAPKNKVGDILSKAGKGAAGQFLTGTGYGLTEGQNPLQALATGASFAPYGLLHAKNAEGQLKMGVNPNEAPKMAKADLEGAAKALERLAVRDDPHYYMSGDRVKDQNFIRQMAADYFNKDFATQKDFQTVAQEVANRVRIDQGMGEINLPRGMGIIDQGEFKPPYKKGDITYLKKGLNDLLGKSKPLSGSRMDELQAAAKSGDPNAIAHLDLVKSVESDLKKAQDAKNALKIAQPNVAQQPVGDIKVYHGSTGERVPLDQRVYPPSKYEYVTPDLQYAKNFGKNISQKTINPKNPLDLTSLQEKNLTLKEFKDILSSKGVNTGNIKATDNYNNKLPAWWWLREHPELVDSIKSSGKDSVFLQESAGKFKNKNSIIILDKQISSPQQPLSDIGSKYPPVPTNQQALLKEANKRGYNEKNPLANISNVKTELQQEMDNFRTVASGLIDKYKGIANPNDTRPLTEIMSSADKKIYQDALLKSNKASDLLKTEFSSPQQPVGDINNSGTEAFIQKMMKERGMTRVQAEENLAMRSKSVDNLFTKNPSSSVFGETQTKGKPPTTTAQQSQLGVSPEATQIGTEANPINSSTSDYIKQMQEQQKQAGNIDKGGIIERGKNFLADVKRKLVDSTAPIEDILSSAQKKGKYSVLPSHDISPQIDRAIRSHELAGQFLKDNGMVDTIKGAPDINALNQYLIAKHAAEVGTTTGRNAQADAQLVKELAPIYEPYAQKVVQYGQNLLDKAVETGLVSQETATMLKKKYPNYVPLNRIFNELEKASVPEGTGGRGPASLSKQTVVQKLKGSERAIQNPIESLLTKTTDVFSQGERNQAGQMLASYKDLPGNPFQLRELKPGESAVHTISYLDNGVKKTFETTPEIAQAAKFLDKRQLGLIGQIFATPVRLARVGITGINIPFIASNVVKDQVSATINSNRALSTSIANPRVFLKSLWTAIGHGSEYDNWVRNAGGGTSFDISRSAPSTSVAQIRSNRNVGSKIAYTATHPGELLRAVEDVVNRGEEMTRLQQYIGTRDALLKEGRTAQDANILAAKASRENTVNFGRSGDWGKALNSVFLYMNAGIQGSRTLVRNLQTRPAQTATKIGLTVFVPLATVTAWNMSDPKRLQAYNDIRDFEKENNMVIIPPNPTKDPKTGKWNVIKVPFSQEVANLTIPVRKSIEALHGADGPGFMDVAAGLLGSTTSLNTQTPNALVGQFIPQAVKPGLEAVLNKNLFSGTDIVPQYLPGGASKDLPPDMQAYSDTSGTARIIAKPLNISPLKVEQFVKSTTGGVGSQVINASDQILNKLGVIPKEQIGGQSIQEGLLTRFVQASGGQQLTNLFNNKQPKGTTPNGKGSTNSNIIENRGKYYVNFGNGNVKSYDSLEKAQNVIVTNDNKSIDLSPPTKGQGIGAFANQNWNITKAREVWNANLDQSQKDAAFKKLGVDPQDVRYDALATYSNDIKTQYLLSKSPDHNTLLNNIMTGRVESIGGSQFAANGVIDNLVEQGQLSKAEGTALKKIKIDKNGKNLNKATGGRKIKIKKLKAISIKFPSAKKYKKVKLPKITKVKQYKLAKVGKITKVKKLKT